MPSVRRVAEVRWTPEQMYALVNDVQAYPEFLHWCSGSRIIAETARELTAELDVGFGGFKQRFSTINSLEPPQRISMRLRKGPFRSLTGAWTFAATEMGCRISLALEFAVSAGPLGLVIGAAFEQIARSQMDAFIKRAQTVYG